MDYLVQEDGAAGWLDAGGAPPAAAAPEPRYPGDEYSVLLSPPYNPDSPFYDPSSYPDIYPESVSTPRHATPASEGDEAECYYDVAVLFGRPKSAPCALAGAAGGGKVRPGFPLEVSRGGACARSADDDDLGIAAPHPIAETEYPRPVEHPLTRDDFEWS